MADEEQTEQNIDFETSDTEMSETTDAASSIKREKTGTIKFVENKRKHLLTCHKFK